MIAIPPVDPFEVEHPLLPGAQALSFAPRALELPLEELVRLMAFDLVGAIPRPAGAVDERLGEPGRGLLYAASFFQIGQSVLGVATEIDEGTRRHRVVELLGAGGDSRVRMNLTLLRQPDPALSRQGQDAVAAGRPLGQVRIWTGNEPTAAADKRQRLARSLASAGLDVQTLPAGEAEPMYRPPAADRLAVELPSQDIKVAGDLLGLLLHQPVEGQAPRPPRRIGVHAERVRRPDGTIVSWHFETHRGATGVVHARRREVEAGFERPGLVRTFNVAGLRGAGRLRIREVGGKAVAEFAGTRESVAAIRQGLEQTFKARA